MSKNSVCIFKGSLMKIRKKILTFTISEWVEVSMWFNTLIFLFTFSIYVSEVSGSLTTSSANKVAALGFLFALFLIGSLIFTVFRKLASKKNNSKTSNMGEA